jgi:hypothetical protein
MRAIILVSIVAALIAGSFLFTYFEIYPGWQVFYETPDLWTTWTTSGPHLIAVAEGVNSGSANRLQISLSTIQNSTVYIINATQALIMRRAPKDRMHS